MGFLLRLLHLRISSRNIFTAETPTPRIPHPLLGGLGRKKVLIIHMEIIIDVSFRIDMYISRPLSGRTISSESLKATLAELICRSKAHKMLYYHF